MTVQEYLIDYGYENNAVEIVTYNGDGYNRLCINFDYITCRHSLDNIPKDLREREVLSVNFFDDGYLLIEV